MNKELKNQFLSPVKESLEHLRQIHFLLLAITATMLILYFTTQSDSKKLQIELMELNNLCNGIALNIKENFENRLKYIERQEVDNGYLEAVSDLNVIFLVDLYTNNKLVHGSSRRDIDVLEYNSSQILNRPVAAAQRAKFRFHSPAQTSKQSL
ncbi:MAG: hypothetical protein ACO1RX_07605 [Candidatus Sericytochromatia bacterium]